MVSVSIDVSSRILSISKCILIFVVVDEITLYVSILSHTFFRPTIRKKEYKHKKNQKKKSKLSTPNVTSILPEISKCPCGAERTFEFQIVSSALHVLNVDQHASNTQFLNDEKQFVMKDNGGMNWGVIAIYSCPISCDYSREEFVIIQASIDDVATFQMKRSDSMDHESDNDSEEQ